MIGNARSRAACAVVLACALIPAALAGTQSSNSSSTAPKKSASKTTAHHTTAKKSSGHASTHKTAASSATKSSTTHSASHSYSSHKGKKTLAKRPRGQQKIDSERAQEIQSALIREHYLSGDATGTWNQASEDAMRRYQNDHGWQTKEVPDSRALIKLGLGPSKDHLLNPESAMTSSPDAPKSASLPTTSQTPIPVSATPGSATTQPQR